MNKARNIKLSAEDIECYRELYNSLDTNKDGKIDREEITPILKESGVGAEFNELCFFVFDENENGLISFDEFLAFLSLFEESSDTKEIFKFVFNKLDTDKNGEINYEELKKFAVLFHIDNSPETLAQCFAEFGKTVNETLKLDEILRALNL